MEKIKFAILNKICIIKRNLLCLKNLGMRFYVSDIERLIGPKSMKTFMCI